MMTSNKPWQAVVNPNNLAPIVSMDNKLAAVKKNTGVAEQITMKMKVVKTKRYSFDDNGGGYEGL